ncbi:MAG TPA: type I DNA topoisomerase [Candidatus Omnitrophota bacterium]|nr:type I DNA topoisomerase [Candidatus Omnitrophota bacterium]HRZ14610.1 type I DNA topoisomerase [Candidatus Omnitrophota bacterium]
MSAKQLIIVESPTKAKTIGKIMGKDYSVMSTMGHMIDLPKTKLGVDIEKGFEPSYVILTGRKKVVAQLKKEAAAVEHIYIATDPDREGEAIGWHIKARFLKDKSVSRVNFHEITAEAVKHAFTQPREFDANMIEAQTSRRILDRIVGYYLSPLLWKKIARGLSAGRVQSVALRLIVERERQIQAFVPQEYWEIEARLQQKASPAVFIAKLTAIDGQKVQVAVKEEADKLLADIQSKQFTVQDIRETEKRRNPDAPFITSTLQQEAFNKLRYNAVKTMLVAQQLYEGIDIGEETPVGLITYMRTDSTTVAAEAVAQVRSLIEEKYGKPYLPEKPPVYKSKKFAQQAHEAIRPTLIRRPPESLRQFLTPEQAELYQLIYNRFIASQMTPSVYKVISVDIRADRYGFSASGSTLLFDGFSTVYVKEDEEKDKEKEKQHLPVLSKEEILDLVGLDPSQHFTKPPARFSDSSLVKILEEEGIGRPSTYAPIISTLIQRGYVHRIKGYLNPSELGFKVCDMLVSYFPEILDVKFTAYMEEELDEVEDGTIKGVKVLNDFYTPFKNSFDYAQNNIKKEVIEAGENCEKCGKPMIIKWGRKGKFLSCSGFPECKHSKSITTGIKCPQPDCTGEIIERRSKRGAFYGCTRYPNCTYTAKTLPEQKEE